jgi:hypothetical protein
VQNGSKQNTTISNGTAFTADHRQPQAQDNNNYETFSQILQHHTVVSRNAHTNTVVTMQLHTKPHPITNQPCPHSTQKPYNTSQRPSHYTLQYGITLYIIKQHCSPISRQNKALRSITVFHNITTFNYLFKYTGKPLKCINSHRICIIFTAREPTTYTTVRIINITLSPLYINPLYLDTAFTPSSPAALRFVIIVLQNPTFALYTISLLCII